VTEMPLSLEDATNARPGLGRALELKVPASRVLLTLAQVEAMRDYLSQWLANPPAS
jgi:hypothetical protein